MSSYSLFIFFHSVPVAILFKAMNAGMWFKARWVTWNGRYGSFATAAGQGTGMVWKGAVDEGEGEAWITAWVLFQVGEDLKWKHGKETYSQNLFSFLSSVTSPVIISGNYLKKPNNSLCLSFSNGIMGQMSASILNSPMSVVWITADSWLWRSQIQGDMRYNSACHYLMITQHTILRIAPFPLCLAHCKFNVSLAFLVV